MKIYANAKINLSLNITGVNGGYHDLESVVTTVSLSDVLRAKKSYGNVVKYKNFSISPEKDNVYKALDLLTQKFGGHLCVRIKKNIPEKAGLGGSSALVAGVIRAYERIYNITDKKALEDIAVAVGSDVLCQYIGGFMTMYGRGERVEKILCDKKLYFAVVVPSGGVDTAACFKLYDQMGKSGNIDNDKLIAYLNGKEKDLVIGNALYLPATELNASVKAVYESLKEKYFAVNMSGSGSAVYALFDNKRQALKAVKELKKEFEKVYFCRSE